ncbi:MAG TPA: glycosyltransferase family 2 protein [Gemmatimonadaceae bacterium]|nr:glycosyltransferase family 2 protein [Gemmatimonadaceae bacterium]
MNRPLLSVIVPTYGRWQHIGPLLDSILAQDFDDWECVVAEDGSPNQEQVRAEVAARAERANGRIRFEPNPKTLGYDANFRRLIELARGRFVFVMGDDDFVAPGAFRAVAGAIERYPNIGMVLRAFAWFRDTPDNVIQISRYYPRETFFPAGPKAIVACYRRAVVMSGLVLDRDLAQSFATDRWDGTVFYQQWLVANILVTKDAVYLPQLLAYFRRGGTPIFGTAEKEKGLYTPGVQPPDTDLRMNQSLLSIARAVEQERGVPIAAAIERDFAHYIYHTLAHQAHVPRREFKEFYKALGKQGLNKYPSYHAWYWAIRIFGADNLDRLFQLVRRVLGHTPNLSAFTRGGRRGHLASRTET